MTQDAKNQLLDALNGTPADPSPLDNHLEDLIASLGEHLSDSDVEHPHYAAAQAIDWLRDAMRDQPESFGIVEATA